MEERAEEGAVHASGGAGPGQAAESAAPPEDAHEDPRGTMVLMLIYIIVTIGIFGSVYLTLLARG